MKADWKVVADMHWEKVYLPALKELNENKYLLCFITVRV